MCSCSSVCLAQKSVFLHRPALTFCKLVFHTQQWQNELPYKGPYKIISRKDKFFTLDLRDRIDNNSIDHLKSAHILPGDENNTAMQSDTFESQYCAVAKLNSSSCINF